MKEPFFIRKIAVLGAGVMGAQIAAHCVNAGFETLLFDLAAKEGDPNALVNKAIAHLGKLKPSPLAAASTSELLQACNYQDDLQDLSHCDLIIEAIAERMDWKEDLYQRIIPFLRQHSILVTNTSGLSINTLNNVLPQELRKRFCGVHFFNPPRYMHLAELIPAKETSSELLNHLESWLTSYLGKGVVRAKDTPNFIANRIGVFSLLATLHHAQEMELGLDEVDALTGPLLGRPKSATFRTMDVVGLDTMHHVVKTMEDELKDDPWHKIFHLPAWLNELIQQGHLGQKTGQGIYRKNGKIIEVYDIQQKGYRPANANLSETVQEVMKITDPVERMQQLIRSEDKQAQFIARCLRDVFHYCAYHLQTIADTVRDVDLALRWGFGWQQGPFETWQYSGMQQIIHFIQQTLEQGKALAQVTLPGWLQNIEGFYNSVGAFSPSSQNYQPRSSLPVYKKQYFPDSPDGEQPRFKAMYENAGVSLWHLKDEVAVLSFKTKANNIGQEVLDGMAEALLIAERQSKGLIIYQKDAANFSAGADLKSVSKLIKAEKFDAIASMISQFQKLVMQLRYCAIPTVAALRGRALGGGCEIILHCNAVVAAFESYPGLVEASVGLIPAGGGCKEMARRAADKSRYGEVMDWLEPFFKQIATCVVSGSAKEAKLLGYLQETDTCIMHPQEVLFAALAKINYLSESNYQPPISSRFKIAGLEGHARIQTGLVNWLEGGFISEHDYFIANETAKILCGGELNQGEKVDEEWLLQLEREAFIKLCAMPKTLERMSYFLETGKILRN